MRRVAEKLLHQPTVRVKELANEAGAISYAAALAELFALDPEAVEAVTRVEACEHRDQPLTGPSTGSSGSTAPSGSGPAPARWRAPRASWSPTSSAPPPAG